MHTGVLYKMFCSELLKHGPFVLLFVNKVIQQQGVLFAMIVRITIDDIPAGILMSVLLMRFAITQMFLLFVMVWLLPVITQKGAKIMLGYEDIECLISLFV